MMDSLETATRPSYFENSGEPSAFLEMTDFGGIAPSLQAKLAKLRRVRVQRRMFAVALLASDVGAGFFGVLLGQLFRQGGVDIRSAAATLAAALPVYFLASLQTGAHSPSIAHKASSSIRRAFVAFIGTAAIFFLGAFFIEVGDAVSRVSVAQTMVACLCLGIAGRLAISMRARRLLSPKPWADLCIYDDVSLRGASRTGSITAAEAGLVLNFSEQAMVERLGLLAQGMDRIIVHCSPARRETWSRALKCVDIRSEIVVPELTELMPLAIRMRAGDVSLVLANGPLRWHQHVTKKIFDRVFAFCALAALSPLMLAIGIAIKIDSPGPVFFRQDRIGLGNRRFKIWKFRSMRHERTDHVGAVSATRDDDRITRVGRFLRKTSLDELPQILNVLTGQMSVVGPRPHAVGSKAEESLFWHIDQRYWYRHSIRPGITGLAQIRGLRGATHTRGDLERRLHADLEYVANYSLAGDIRIILQTFAVLLHKNAY